MDALEHLLMIDLLKYSASRPLLYAITIDPSISPNLEVTADFKLPNHVLLTASSFTLGYILYTPLLISQGYDFSDEELILDIRDFPKLLTMKIAQALKHKSRAFYKVFMARGTNVPKG